MPTPEQYNNERSPGLWIKQYGQLPKHDANQLMFDGSPVVSRGAIVTQAGTIKIQAIADASDYWHEREYLLGERIHAVIVKLHTDSTGEIEGGD